MKKKTAVIITALITSILIVFSASFLIHSNTTEQADKAVPNYNLPYHSVQNSSNDVYRLHDNNFQLELTKETIKITVPQEFKQETTIIPIDKLLFHIRYVEDASHQLKSILVGLKPNMSDT